MHFAKKSKKKYKKINFFFTFCLFCIRISIYKIKIFQKKENKRMETRNILLALYYKSNGDWDLMYKYIRDKEGISTQEINEALEKCKRNFLTIIDDNYPEKLKRYHKPPFIVFYEGDLSVLKTDDLILSYTKNNTLQFDEPNVVKWHNECDFLDFNGSLKLFMDDKSLKEYMSLVVLFNKVVIDKHITTEKDKKKANIIINNALNFGSDIYVKPTSGKSFNNQLIKEGAFLIDEKSDVL